MALDKFKMFNTAESIDLADMKLQPLAHFLYMTLRVSFPGIFECGLGKVHISEMKNITNLSEEIIKDVLIPELIRNDLIFYDNSVVFIPGTAITEKFFTTSRLFGDNGKNFRPVLLKALKQCEGVVSTASNYGGPNLAMKKFVEHWGAELDLLISWFVDKEVELNQLKESVNFPPTPEQKKQILQLTTTLTEFRLCKTLIARKNSYKFEPFEAPAEPFEAPAEPFEAPAEPFEAPAEPFEAPAEPFEAPAEPFEAPAEPFEAPAEPFEAPAEPFEAPAEPFEAPAYTHTIPYNTPQGKGEGKKGEEEKFPLPEENREGVWGNKNPAVGEFAPGLSATLVVSGHGHTLGRTALNGQATPISSPSLNGTNPLHSKDSLSQSQPLEYESTARRIQRKHAEEAAAAQRGAIADDDIDDLQPHPG